MPKGKDVARLRQAGAAVADGPTVSGARWLRVKHRRATYYVAERDETGLSRLADGLERNGHGKPADVPRGRQDEPHGKDT